MLTPRGQGGSALSLPVPSELLLIDKAGSGEAGPEVVWKEQGGNEVCPFSSHCCMIKA